MLTVWAIYLAQEVGNCKLKEIAQAFSLKVNGDLTTDIIGQGQRLPSTRQDWPPMAARAYNGVGRVRHLV